MSEFGRNSGLEAVENNIPPVGQYPFVVVSKEQTFTGANSAHPGTDMDKVVISITTPEGQHYPITDYFVYSVNNQWKFASFLECVGVKKVGEPISNVGKSMDNAIGKEGIVKIKHEQFNGRESVKIDKYIVGKAATAPKSPAINPDDVPFEID